MDQNKTIQENQALIETLKREAQDLLKQKKDIVADINKPIHEARDKASKVIAEAYKKERAIIKAADDKTLETTLYCNQKRAEAEALVAKENKGLEEINQLRKELENQRTAFTNYEISMRNRIEADTSSAEKTNKEALELKEQFIQANTRLIERENKLKLDLEDISKKQSELIVSQTKLNQSLKQIEEVKIYNTTTKNFIELAQAENSKLIQQINIEKEEIEIKLKENKDTLAKVKSDKEKIETANIENGKRLNMIAKEQADLDERKRSLDERKRLDQVMSRQLDDKIRTLKKLREELENK